MINKKAATQYDSGLQLQEGFIFGADSKGCLAETPVTEVRTRLGDELVVASHHGYGYKKTNEDRVAFVEVDGEFGLNIDLFVVDGMGGRERGDLAAQILSEELILAAGPIGAEVEQETHSFVKDKVETLLWKLPTRDFVQRVLESWQREMSVDASFSDPLRLIRSARDVVSYESLQSAETAPDKLRRVAEVLHALAGLNPPDPTEVAMRRTRRRIAIQHPGPSAPDACFIGALIRTQSDGRRFLDVRQVGDCGLLVAGADGKIRFRTFGESVLPEPNLKDPALSLTDIMAYSLHRNLVRNSVNSPKSALKRYRRQDVPLNLESGDIVVLYSDGVDDLFSPEELVELALKGGGARSFVSELLLHSERRMKYVADLLHLERARLPDKQKMKAYPSVHERLNRARMEHGSYLEIYDDGATGSWTKPPKCDNTSVCALYVG
ncbi:MAG: protein phosphatase 2C domain-containing protein [Thermoanaerobaculales bacterium]|nr:protein phosphatase 2C domain-containing protein [Thermoanaerobaculales bacterium]